MAGRIEIREVKDIEEGTPKLRFEALSYPEDLGGAEIHQLTPGPAKNGAWRIAELKIRRVHKRRCIEEVLQATRS